MASGHGASAKPVGGPRSATTRHDHSLHFTSEERLDNGVLARQFTFGEIPGTLWTPESAAPALLILIGHNGGLHRREPRLVARARQSAAYGYSVAAIDAPGHGDRPRSAADEQARADLRRAMQAGEPVDEIFESFIGPLAEKTVPEWRTAPAAAARGTEQYCHHLQRKLLRVPPCRRADDEVAR